jgi:PST family polysaccharide transporter
MGARYWALVVGFLAGRSLNLVLVWWACKWRPSLRVRQSLFWSLVGFSTWVFLSGLQTWLFLYADNLLVGYFYGVYELGVYSMAFNLANLLPAMLIAPLAAVAFPAFSALQEDVEDVGQSLVKLQKLAAGILFPVCFGVAALAEPAVRLLYGDKWIGLGWTLSLLALMPGMSHLWSLNAEAYRGVGHPDIWTKVAAGALLVLFPLLLLAGRFLTYQEFVIARFIGALALPILNAWAASRVLRVSIREQWRSWRIPAGCALVMFGLIVWLSAYLTPFTGMWGWAKLGLLIGLGAVFYLLSLRQVDRLLFDRLRVALGRVGLS